MRADKLVSLEQAPAAAPAPELDLQHAIDRLRERVDGRLSSIVAEADRGPERLHGSINHSLLAPGKRVRGVLVLVSALHFGGDEARAVTSACAIEMVHAASLILDDLPAMDDATLRRGRPANHRVFGEATAILAAIALLNRAYEIVAGDESQPIDCRLKIVACLSAAIGTDGLVAGQEMDLHPEANPATPQVIERMHRRKTAALFGASAEIGALAAGVRDARLAQVRQFGECVGLAFQGFDDLLDACGDISGAGKDVRQDDDKPTLVAALGMAEAEREAVRQIDRGLAVLPPPSAGDCLLGACARSVAASLRNRLDAMRRSSGH